MTLLHVTVWDDSNGDPAVLVHGSGTWGTHSSGFASQRSLADSYRLLLPDRLGYGRSPGTERNDFAEDARHIVELLGEGAHLVGHSSGGVVAMLAAATNPDAVRSLTLIEPACYQLAKDDPVVLAALDRMRDAIGRPLPEGLSGEDLVRLNFESAGLRAPEPTPDLIRATKSAVHEYPSWEADIPAEALAAARWRKLVITGTWDVAPAMYREQGGEPLMACARLTAARIGATLLRVPAASHWPHNQRPDIVNPALRDLWR